MNNLKKIIIKSVILLLFLNLFELVNAQQLSRRTLNNQFILGIGSKKMLVKDAPLNRVDDETISNLDCFNTHYRRFITDIFAFGVTLELCSVEFTINQSSIRRSVDFILSFPLKQRIKSGPFSTQNFELGFSLSAGDFKLIIETIDTSTSFLFDTIADEVQGLGLIGTIYLDFGNEIWGFVINVSHHYYDLPEFDSDIIDPNDSDNISRSQRSNILNAGVRFSF